MHCRSPKLPQSLRATGVFKGMTLFPAPKPKRRLEDYKASTRACGLCKAKGAELTLRRRSHGSVYSFAARSQSEQQDSARSGVTGIRQSRKTMELRFRRPVRYSAGVAGQFDAGMTVPVPEGTNEV